MKRNGNYKPWNIKMGVFVSMLFAALLTMSIPVMAADWPMFRNGASNSGNSSETILLPLTEQWHSSAPSVEENGAVVSNGIVYMSSDDSKLYAFEVSTGSAVSGFPVTTAFNYGTPAVDAVNGKVYVLASSSLFAFNLDGTSAWTVAVGGTGNNYNQGPVIDDGFVYIKAGSTLQKWNSSGGLQWSSPTAGVSTQPAIMGDYVYVNSQGGQIRKYDKSTGTEVVAGGFPISTASSQSALTAVDGKIFHKADVVYAYSASDGSLVWSAAAGGNSTYYDSPAVANGVVYVYGWDSKLYAFDENTGAAMAGFPSVALATSGDRNWSSPAVAGDKVFVGAGTTQRLKVLGAAGSASAGVVLEEHLSFSTDPQGFDLCSPIISDGVVFVMLDGGGLYAYFSSDTEWTGGAIIINGGDKCTESQTVTLALDRGSNTDVNQMMISEDPFFASAVWEAYSETKSWTLSAGFGNKTVYVKFRDTSGQISNVFNDQIEYAEICNNPPVAVDDPYTTDENTILSVPAPGVLNNDSDADGDTISAVLVSDVSNGTLTLNGDGSFTYEPNKDFCGEDSFTYKANDSQADSNTATVTITVNCPTAVTLVSFTAKAIEGKVKLEWETATEIDNAGFNLYRAKSKDGRYKKINNALIPAKGNATTGATYSYEDTPGKGAFYYKLEDVDGNGQSTLHGPVDNGEKMKPSRRKGRNSSVSPVSPVK